ncbi:MAG: EamA family transporter [Thiotrichales bacterium]|nr:EamA family transporter [Thiotrichales bacterium]|tara:strand:- start:1319 stop:2221 length:903 start_codon:yes stop_codon:yes gene_type:complete
MPDPQSMNAHTRGVVFVLLSAVLWSTSGLLVRLIGTDEPTMVLWRSLSAAAALSVYVFLHRRDTLRGLALKLGWPGVLLAVLLAADAAISVYALSLSRVANVMLIFSTTPFFAAIIGWLWLREPVKAKTWAAMAACILGVGIMVSGSLGTSLLIGDGLAFVVVLIFATAVVAIRRYPQVDLIAAVWLSSILSAVVILPFSTPFGHAPLDYGLMAFFGAVEYVVALLLFTSGARLIPAAQSTLIGLLEVVLSPIWVWLAINEVPGRPTLIGGALILVTLVLYTLDDWARPKAGGGREADVR